MMVLSVVLDPTTENIDLTQCHTVEVFVAHDFATDQTGATDYQTFDKVGGDSIAWQYVGPAGPTGCRQVNVADAAAPITDAPSDVLSVPPVEAAGDP
jgi:hypothetical protein